MRALVERWVPTLPFVSTFMARCGQIVGTPENCRRLLAADEAILVFPEGVRGLNKPFRERYRLRKFGPGFMRLALESGAPIVPIGVVGAEEQAPALFDLKPLARLLSLPGLPHHAHDPAASRSPPATTSTSASRCGSPGSPDEEDAGARAQGRARSRRRCRALLERGLAERKHVFW